MTAGPDVLVVGGGPGGSALAARAASAGARVLLVEKDRFPRDKVCGEFLSAEGVAVVARLGGLDAITPGAPRIDRCLMSDRRGRTVEVPLPDLDGVGRDALGVSREHLDTVLLELARRRGAEVRDACEATAPIVEDGRVVGVRLRGSGTTGSGEAVRARLVVAADGRRSTLQRALRPRAGDPKVTDPGSRFGLKIHVTGADRVGSRVELHLFDGGYAGLGPVEGGRLNVCLLTTVGALRACGGSPDRLLRERVAANPVIAERLRGVTPCGSWQSVGPLRFGPRRPAFDGVLALGDAAGTVDPFCGEGMSNALLAAEAALPWALEALARGGLDGDLVRGWCRTWDRAFVRVSRRVRLAGTLFEHATLGGLALRAVARPWLGGLLAALVARTRTGQVTAEGPEAPLGRT